MNVIKKPKKVGHRKIKLLGGLRLIKPDPRNFKLGNVFTLPKLEELPKSFEIKTPESWNQGNTDYCAAYGTDLMSFVQEEDTDEPDHRWTFAVAKMIEGGPEEWGLSPISALKAITKYGYVTKKETNDVNFNNSTDERYIENWPKSLFETAAKRKKKSYFQITGQYDNFDNIRASMYLFKDKKQLASLGVLWGWPISDKVMDEPSENGFGHFLVIKGFQEDELKANVYSLIQNSYGLSVGFQGTHLFSRKVINESVKKWGSYMLVDLPREQAEVANAHKIKWQWLAKLLSFFLKPNESKG